ncbi:DUF881 domain-containing protein [Clostridium sediminicola]|uniref:DUF881 domain-containing protein n=1 Tax=Clostridium sediminicola TaxID=3114879 RepID=UPI0031F25A31
MKKISGKIALAIVSILLGFMITYQIKAVSKKGLSSGEKNIAQITVENERLNKQKEELEKQINDLSEQIKVFETAAANEDTTTKAIVQELENTRVLMGKTDVVGAGIILKVTPDNDIFANPEQAPYLNYGDLVKIVNELNFADAEAISINDIRISSRTGIRNAGNAIFINNERIPMTQEVIIKAIGNKEKLKEALMFPGILEESFQGFKTSIQPVDSVEIFKSSINFDFIYAKPLKKD